jgi:tetratricopeptide (TPR) repeat protein
VAIIAKAAIVGIGLPDWVFPGALVVMALGLPVILFTAYTQYVMRGAVIKSPTFTPGGTPSTAMHGTMATMALKASPHLSWRRTAIGGAYAVGAFILVIGGFMLMRAMGIGPAGSLLASGKLAVNERLLLAEIQPRGQDTTLGPVITEALRTSLAQSDRITIMEPTEVREVLRRMQRPLTSRVDFTLAREIATREGIKGVVDGEILSVGGSYKISTKILNAQSGELLASFTESANDAKDVLPAIDRLAKHMRGKIGESLRSVQSSDALERVTTPSLEALRKYVQGAQTLQTTGDVARGVALLEEAIAIDTGFAMAYRKLAQELSNRGGQTSRVHALFQKAYDHRDRVSDAERYLTVADYYASGPKQDLTKAIAAYKSLIELQPTNHPALNNVANIHRARRQFAKAEEYYKRCIASGPPASVFYANLISAQLDQGKIEEAKNTLRAYAAAVPKAPGVVAATINLLVLGGQVDSAESLMRRGLSVPLTDASARRPFISGMAMVTQYRGRIREARQLTSESRAAARQSGSLTARTAAALDSVYYDVWYLDRRKQGVEALDALLRRSPLDSLAPADRPYLEFISLYALAGRPDRARAIATDFERSRASVTDAADSLARHAIAAVLAMADHRYPDAIREYQAADAGSCVTCALPDLGHAYDLNGQSDSAIAVFTRYVNGPRMSAASEAQFRAGTLKRLGELWEQKGDAQKAASYHTQFVELWKNADPELQPQVTEAKKRLARLSKVEGK